MNSRVPAAAMLIALEPAIAPVVPLPICKVPALALVAPVKVFAAVSVVVPLPDWVTTPAPEMMPEAVNVPDWINCTVPASVMVFDSVEPVASLSANVAPLDTLSALDDEIVPVVPLPICSVPALTVVVPV